VFERLADILQRGSGAAQSSELEDIHWADRSTQAFLVYFVESPIREAASHRDISARSRDRRPGLSVDHWSADARRSGVASSRSHRSTVELREQSPAS
jgi:hypothetical protein